MRPEGDETPDAVDQWSGTRETVHGAPLALLVGVALVLVVTLTVMLRRDVGVAALVASHYVDLMAGTLTPEVETSDPEVVADRFARGKLEFQPGVASLEPEFTLIGGRVHRLGERPVAAWFYRDRRFDTLLAEAFEGTLEDLGRPDEVRDEPPLRLYIFRKTTQTLVFWQAGPLVYVVTGTLPGERTIALARRVASTPSAAHREPAASGGTEADGQ